jgi:hypothetical protein
MDEFLKVSIGSLLSFIALIVSMLVGAGTLYQRFTGPTEKRWEDLMRWKKKVDKKLLRDFRAIDRLEDDRDNRYKFENLILRSLEAIIAYLSASSVGNSDDMQGILKDIMEFYKDERANRSNLQDPIDLELNDE